MLFIGITDSAGYLPHGVQCVLYYCRFPKRLLDTVQALLYHQQFFSSHTIADSNKHETDRTITSLQHSSIRSYPCQRTSLQRNTDRQNRSKSKAEQLTFPAFVSWIQSQHRIQKKQLKGRLERQIKVRGIRAAHIARNDTLPTKRNSSKLSARGRKNTYSKVSLMLNFQQCFSW